MPLKIESNIDIEDYLKKQKLLIDDHLEKIFKESSNYVEPKELWDAIKYSVLNGSKRIRGILCLTTYKSLGGNNLNACLTTACSIEMIHTMSLIHDDLPSMDNDDTRRGKPSCHKAFGEAQAILAGDAMLSLAFQLIAEDIKEISDAQKLELIKTLTNSFTHGLVPGQILDLSVIGKECGLELIQKISTLKTAELIRASVICGAILSKERTIEQLNNFGLNIGIAFQIIDDILDVTCDTKTLGKTSGKDEMQKKPTFPQILGIENSKNMAKDFISKAKLELNSIPGDTSYLSSMADYIINRIN